MLIGIRLISVVCDGKGVCIVIISFVRVIVFNFVWVVVIVMGL